MFLALRETIGDEKFDDLAGKVYEELKNSNESDDGGFSYSSTYLLAVGSPV